MAERASRRDGRLARRRDDHGRWRRRSGGPGRAGPLSRGRGGVRSFVALELPEALCAPLADLADRVPLGRPVPEDNLHLTLAFLGDQPLAALEEVAGALDALPWGPVPLTVTGLGVFGAGAPRQVHAAVAPDLELIGTERRAASAARAAGLALAHRRFVPHVTLARLGGRRLSPDAAGRLAAFLTAAGNLHLGPVPAPALTLYESTLTPDGPIYTPLTTWPLPAD
ncbi:RNA 2',3'-cyclic phosphodiesterase [Rhodobacteraceae bacterium CCMM004]|nr:RNA 2',3'-cyclic phosphodiesterase [Rhodobacteraceae bacterium CCMM004]